MMRVEELSDDEEDVGANDYPEGIRTKEKRERLLASAAKLQNKPQKRNLAASPVVAVICSEPVSYW